MQNRILKFNDAAIVATASVVGGAEYEGPLGQYFDLHDPSDKFGKKTWELAESEMQRLAFNTAESKLSASERRIDALFAGDLLQLFLKLTHVKRRGAASDPQLRCRLVNQVDRLVG